MDPFNTLSPFKMCKKGYNVFGRMYVTAEGDAADPQNIYILDKHLN